MTCVEDASCVASSRLCPKDVLRTAHQLLVKWDILQERQQIWSELRSAMNVLGQAVDWELPARLRLVGVVVQVTDALPNRVQTPGVRRAVLQWLANLKNRQAPQKMDALGLLGELGSCVEGAATPDSATTPIVDSGDLEMQVVDAARALSLDLEPQVLEQALSSAVVAKDFNLAQKLLDELKLLFKFSVASEAAPESRAAATGMQSGIASHESAHAAHTEVMHKSLDLDSGVLAEAASNAEDVEETLAAMMEMGEEELPSEAKLSPEPTSRPQQQLNQLSLRDSFQLSGEKRKYEVIDDSIEDVLSPPKAQAVLSHGHASSSSGNALFDDPIFGSEVPSHSSTALFDAPVRSSGLLSQPASSFGNSDPVTAAEVPEGKRERVSWTTEEEQRLIEGHGRYGNRWENIRMKCGLKHRFATQIRDKWVNLLKSGRVKKMK